ncbi:hypothetical protein [Blastococcus saxobsidens]|uniref:hypothetical protein n=1 Tax=Blastococcus saxobsidens TaxID=138336 RepID=UPI000CEBD9C2|nr:hypothetical protein [Blastococcus saxobsidens]
MTLSVWKDDLCVGSVQLAPAEVVELVTGLTQCLAHLAGAGAGQSTGEETAFTVRGPERAQTQ